MKKKRYSEEQIVRILRETDRDTVPEVAKRHGVSEASIYVWRKRFGAMGLEDPHEKQSPILSVFYHINNNDSENEDLDNIPERGF